MQRRWYIVYSILFQLALIRRIHAFGCGLEFGDVKSGSYYAELHWERTFYEIVNF